MKKLKDNPKLKDILTGLIGIAFYFFVMFILTDYILAPLVRKLFISGNESSNTLYYIDSLYQLAIYLILFIPLFFLLKVDIKEDIADEYKDTSVLAKKAGISLFCFYLATFCVNILVSMYEIDMEVTNQESIVTLLKSSIVVYVIMVITTGIIGPIVEELVYRKCFFKLIPNKLIALIISSVIFGFVHVISTDTTFKNQIILSIPYVSSGFLFGIIYIKNDQKILLPIIIHAISNLISVILITM